MDKKISYEHMEFLYEIAIQAAIKTLFEENHDKHGWTYKEFNDTMVTVIESMMIGKQQQWVN